MKKIFVFGATSHIVQETIKLYANINSEFYLVAKDFNKLEIVKADLLARGADNVFTETCDAIDYTKHSLVIDDAYQKLGHFDIAIIGHGTLPDNENIRKNNLLAIKEFEINCNSYISLCSVLSNYFEIQKSGTIAVITSVAGDRGRQSNFIYGSAKGAVSLYLQGLRNRLFEFGVNVITIKPGMVLTQMTANLPKSPLMVKPELIGKLIFNSIETKKDIVYLPSFWKLIMFIIRNIPESIFKKLKL